jgi:hypothetical protein
MRINFIETSDGTRYQAKEALAADVLALPEPHRTEFAELFGVEIPATSAETTTNTENRE